MWWSDRKRIETPGIVDFSPRKDSDYTVVEGSVVEESTTPTRKNAWRSRVRWFLHIPEHLARRRMPNLLNGAQLAMMRVDGRWVPAVKHRPVFEPVLCLVGLGLFWIMGLVATLSAALGLALVHGVVVFVRGRVHEHRMSKLFAFPVAVVEAVVALWLSGNSATLLTVYFLFVYLPAAAFSVLAAWRMDCEFVSESRSEFGISRVLRRTLGLGIYRWSYPADVLSLRTAKVSGPYFGTRFGATRPDTPQPDDKILKMFVTDPNQWSSYLLQCKAGHL